MKNTHPDAELLVGTWEATEPGKAGEIWGRATWTIDDELGLTVAYPEEDGRFTTWDVKIDPDKAPKEIDVGGFKGIYAFDGDLVRVAYTSGDRPATFDAEPEVYCYVLRRTARKE